MTEKESLKLKPLHSALLAFTLSGPGIAYAGTPPNTPPPYTVSLQGTANFRDLGGYLTEGGQRVRTGMLYRADELSRLSATDQTHLLELGIRQVVDFRSEAERQRAPDQLPASIRYIPIPVTVEATAVGDIQQRIFAPDNTAAAMSDFLQSAYRDFIVIYTPQYRQFMQGLLDGQEYPQVFHCTAGKDRTGMAAALVLTAIGVPRETILQDYLASNRLTTERVNQRVEAMVAHSGGQANREALTTLLQVQPVFLQATYTAIDQQYGSIDNYLTQGLGIGPAQRQILRQKLLEP
ncbi:tyrosine-protein phosphatase [Aquipseudomonas ullengensis]|uniref:Tyrosine-protein phosphatase n=1 Tax=Aquipseudomonas ullengensis TaxID=2759166 RepID=A0A7W4LQB5_9GAMM|nr:tyrosine-protein phosphatase [Pseudomonas ullengensis]MBB2497406.1 tyrosine-protein phosphatase [Pseudomonas ullengensis]